jgi:hypothetical protein
MRLLTSNLRLMLATALCYLLVLTLAACGNSTGESTPTAGSGPTFTSEAGENPMPTALATDTAEPIGGASVQPTVTDFQVWQDFMPVVPPGGPPLHATLTVVVSDSTRYTPDNASGTIIISRPDGEVIARAGLMLNRQVDDLGMAQPGPQNLVLNMEAAPVSAKLTEHETLTGQVELTLSQHKVNLTLPETQLMFTH